MYTGLVSEDAKKPMIPGVGIAPTFTISRAVLSDAVALVRGDRFYTVYLQIRPRVAKLLSNVNRLTIIPKI